MTDAHDWDEAAFARLRKLGGQAFLEKMIDTFLEHTPQRLEAVRAGARANDAEAIRQGAHSLKSSAGNLGARRLQQLCERIEVMALEKKAAELPPLLSELDAVFPKVVAHLQSMKRGGAG